MLPLGSGRLARVLAALCWAAGLACLAVWLQARAAVGSSWLVVPLACVLGDVPLEVRVTREQFDAMTRPLVERTLSAVRKVLRDARIEAGAQILAFTHIDGATVGPASRIGPYARLRPGAELGPEVHIGNFVEVKNSTIAAQSKANHLAYIGDARIGQRVNVGAGTITCNYDGANKHLTVIEDDAFIGSDTQLVAPVTVGRGATLGAGTTLTKDAPPDTLTVSRARQMSLPGWQRPVKIPKK
mgnify:CR=1 FL=1